MFARFSYHAWVTYIFIILSVFSGLFGLGFFVTERQRELEKGNLEHIRPFPTTRTASRLIETMNSLICTSLVVVALNHQLFTKNQQISIYQEPQGHLKRFANFPYEEHLLPILPVCKNCLRKKRSISLLRDVVLHLRSDLSIKL